MVQSDMISTDRVRPCFSEKPETIPAKNQGCASGRSIHQIVMTCCLTVHILFKRFENLSNHPEKLSIPL